MGSYELFGLTFASLLLCLSASIEFENRVRTCLDNPNSNIDKCLSQLLEDIKPRLSIGVPEINIPILEPFDMGSFRFIQKEGAVNIEATFRNVLVEGFSNFTLVSMRSDLKKFKLRTQVFIPRLRAKGIYRLNGNLLFFEVKGTGPFRAILRNIKAVVTSDIVRKVENGKERLGVANTVIDFHLEKARTRLDNLFGGDPILGETVNHFINDNDKLILKEVKPAVEKEMGLLIQTVVDNAISVLPLDIGDTLPPLYVGKSQIQRFATPL